MIYEFVLEDGPPAADEGEDPEGEDEASEGIDAAVGLVRETR